MADEDEAPGFSYFVSEEMLQRFATSTTLQRLTWLEEMRCFSWAAANDETREQWRRLRAHRPRPSR